MTDMELKASTKEWAAAAVAAAWISLNKCLIWVVEVEEAVHKVKRRLRPCLKKWKSLQKKLLLVAKELFHIKDTVHVDLAVAQEVKKPRNVKPAKVEVLLSKWFKWVQVCTLNPNKPAENVKVKAKSSKTNVNFVMVKKLLLNQKRLIFQSNQVLMMNIFTY